jgi:hypothetical protein
MLKRILLLASLAAALGAAAYACIPIPPCNPCLLNVASNR